MLSAKHILTSSERRILLADNLSLPMVTVTKAGRARDVTDFFLLYAYTARKTEGQFAAQAPSGRGKSTCALREQMCSISQKRPNQEASIQPRIPCFA
jgi:hypothetical protein